MSKDPVKHCNLYKEEGCVHVDGTLCDFNTCTMRTDHDNKYAALVKLMTEHNKACDDQCTSWSSNCSDSLAVGLMCDSCPRYYKVIIK